MTVVMKMRVWMATLALACAATAGGLVSSATAQVAQAAGSELLGFPSLADSPTYPEASSTIVPVAAVGPPTAAPSPPLTFTPLAPLLSLTTPAQLLAVPSTCELERAAKTLERVQELLAEQGEWLAHESPTPRPAATPRAARPARPARAERAERRHGWSYADDEDTEDAKDEVRTDTTFAVRPGTVLVLENFGGSIDVKSWGRNAVRVRAMHGPKSWVSLESIPGRLQVSSQSRFGPPGAVDYELMLPRWMKVSLSGVYNDVNAEGLEGGMTVETVSGDIKAIKVMGDIALRSVQGTVIVEDSKGNLQVSSVNDGVRVVRADGPVAAEAVNGDIQLVDLTSRDVEATTVSGEVVYAGTIFDDGDYKFSTHSGDIAFALSDAANATVSVATFSGEFESPYPVRIKKVKKDKRFRFVLGSGTAKVNLESFDGAIQLFRPGEKVFKAFTMGEWLGKQKEREKEKELKNQRGREEDRDEDDAADDDR